MELSMNMSTNMASLVVPTIDIYPPLMANTYCYHNYVALTRYFIVSRFYSKVEHTADSVFDLYIYTEFMPPTFNDVDRRG